jgi:DNA polymerase I-like protein with 3'-5' exonuclease and polymerase domains
LLRQTKGTHTINQTKVPMQGSSADIIKKAMLDVDAWIGRNNPDIKIRIFHVHYSTKCDVSYTPL